MYTQANIINSIDSSAGEMAMRRGTIFGALFVLFGLSACVPTPYQDYMVRTYAASGGLVVEPLKDDKGLPIDNGWHIHFDGNEQTTQETAQTYGLYRAALLTLDQGFDGFEILLQYPEMFSDAWINPLSQKAQLIIIAPPPQPDFSYRMFSLNIKLVRRPFTAEPPKIFDAMALRSTLEPYVTGKKCAGNVCPHTHDYLGIKRSS